MRMVRAVVARVEVDEPGGGIRTFMTDVGPDAEEAAPGYRGDAEDRAVNKFEVMIKDADQLRKVLAQIKGVRGVLGVERL